MTEPLTKSGDWSYCPACGGRIDTGYECGQCGRDWLEYHQTGAAIRAQLAQVTAERDDEKAIAEHNLVDCHEAENKVAILQHQLVEAQARLFKLEA